MSFNNLNLQYPYLFYSGLILSVFIIYISFFKIPKNLMRIVGGTKRKGINRNDVFLITLSLLQLFGLFLMSLSSGSPIETRKSNFENKDIRDIYFVVDVSRSMLADDFAPNRLEVAKKYIKSFIELRSVDRIGINIFAEKIVTLSPLTLDHDALIKKIADISIGFLGNGTNIGDGVALAVSRLENSDAKSKVIILLTDGVSNAGSISPAHAGEIAKEKKIKIYGIGIGTSGDAFLPYKVGNRVMKQRIPGGNIDHDLLSQISKDTNGLYYKAENENSLNEIFNSINKLEKTSVKISNPVLIKYNYRIYLFYGFIIFLISEIARRFLFRFSL
jgi:Ca-activated chloride channel homolog